LVARRAASTVEPMNVARDRDPPSAWAARPGLAVTRVIVSAYLALTIGMTFQVSGTDLMVKRVRRVALRHALLSYVLRASCPLSQEAGDGAHRDRHDHGAVMRRT
jgi:hypothetical protein